MDAVRRACVFTRTDGFFHRAADAFELAIGLDEPDAEREPGPDFSRDHVLQDTARRTDGNGAYHGSDSI